MTNQGQRTREPADLSTGTDTVQAVAAGELLAAETSNQPPVKVDPTAAAFFDIDNTVIRGASIFAVARGMLKADVLKRSDMLGFGWKQAKFVLQGTEDMDDIAKIQESALQIIAGRSVTEMREIVDQVFDRYLLDKLWPGTLALAKFHIEAGQRVWLVSATPIEVAEVIAQRLDLSGAIGTRAEIVDGKYTGRLVGLPVHGVAKAQAVAELAEAEGLDLQRCSAYSDSSNDIPMLSMVGNPCAINPDHKLRVHARANGWQLRDFRSTRYAWKIGVPTAAILGLATGAALGSIATARALRQR